MKTLLLTLGILFICIILLGIKVLFIKGAKFPGHHAAHSPELRKKGVGCATHDRD